MATKTQQTQAPRDEVLSQFQAQLGDLVNQFRAETQAIRDAMLQEMAQWRQDTPAGAGPQHNPLQQKVQQAGIRTYSLMHVLYILDEYNRHLPVNPATIGGVSQEAIYDAILKGAARADAEQQGQSR